MEFNRSNVRQLMRLIAFTLILYWALQNYAYLGGFISATMGILRPFIFGGIIAFVLNVPMSALERLLFPDDGHPRPKVVRSLRRPVSLVLTVLLFLGVIVLILILVVPELIKSVTSLAQNLPGFLESAQQWIQGKLSAFPPLANTFGSYTIDWDAVGTTISTWLQTSAGGVLSSTYNWISVFVTGIYSTFLSLIIAIFILARKEVLGQQFSNLFAAYLPQVWAERILAITGLFGNTFSCFISGQLTEASLMGVLFLVSMLILQMPYALLISVLAAITDMIPLIGPFIGCIIGIFLILVVSPIKALWFLLLFLALQQLEQNLLYPRIVGTSVGLPGIWVLGAVMIGGSLFGIIGIFLSIPFFSMLYTLLQESVRRRLKAQREANAQRNEAEAMESDDL